MGFVDVMCVVNAFMCGFVGVVRVACDGCADGVGGVVDVVVLMWCLINSYNVYNPE